MIAAVTVMFIPSPVAQAADNTVVDPDTTNAWTNYTRPDGQPSTQNVGRIWTDKSVFDKDYTFSGSEDLNGQSIQKADGSDFLVGLSALSSTSNLKEMVKTSQPLDIVLVLDTSGSMSGSKMTNLKNAANRFIDATAENNRELEQDQQTRLAIVQFSSGAETQQNLNYVTDQNAQQYKNTINRFSANGATYAEEGLQQAQNVLDRNGRPDVQQIVIFFTDGEPNHQSGFDNEVAAEAVNTAHDMKQGGTIIYAIGVMNGADASVTDDDGFNEYMNGVSSNYPDATADGQNDSWSIFPPSYTEGYYNTDFGTRAEGDYYKAASDPDSIESIFDEISDEVQQGFGSGSPIVDESEEGNTNPGTLTFTDQLGAYMQVTGTGASSDKIQLAYGDTIYTSDKIQLAYGDTIYTSDSKTASGNTDTYHFRGQVEGNAVYGAANLANLVVTVERSNDPAVGDKVTVQLPASLLPLRNYDVDTDNHTMTVAEAYPVRLFYGVSLKAEAKEALSDPTSDVYAAIMGSQKSEDGKTVDFYTNSFVKGAADGSATASFEPNAGNKFYYYTQDTPLYIDQNCTTEANDWNLRDADTLYWKDTYWVQTENGGAEERTAGVAVNRGTAEWEAMESTGGYDGTCYIPAGTPRSDRPATLTSEKTSNATGTATNVLNPAWAGTSVNQHLGNNGKLSFDMPGSLEIKKTVNWGNASDQTKRDKNSFTFKVSLIDEKGVALTGEYPYYIDGASDQAGTVTNGGTITINGGQSVKIEGLPAGTQFTVEEQDANQNGFTTTDASTAEGNDDANDGEVAGEIVGGDNVSTTFTNTYKAVDVNLSTSTILKVKKDLQDRDWRDTDEFTFEIDGLGNTAGPGITTPEPADTTITVNSQTQNHTASFGDITFTAPGEYRYNITEDNDTNPIAGIDYSGAIYRVVITVTDNGTGNLEVSNVAIEQRTNDDGVENNPAVAVQGDTVTFVNKYDADGGTTNIDGTKSYTDTTGGNPINADKFTFKIEALGGYDTDNPQTSPYTYGVDETPLPAGSDEATHSKTVYNTGYRFTFGTIAFDGRDIGRTYEYKVSELAQNKDGQAEDGMTYDKKEYTVKVAVTEVTDADGTHIVATPDVAPKDLVFTNAYKPAEVTLGENGVAPIQGTKTLDGRNMKDDETFFFQLTQTGGPAADGGGFVTVLNQPETVTVSKDNMQSGSADFKFNNLTFSQVGTYTFTVNEVADDQGTETTDGSGMTYDTNVATVTVKVSDNHDGTLKAEVTYSNDKHADTTDKALFANTYEASMNYGAEGEGGINVTKQMLDRPMANNEFSFTIAGTDSSTVKADEANAKLADADKSFQNTAAAENGTATMAKLQNVSFDQDDAGKTFSYLVSETVPADGDKLVNVAYDQSQYCVDIEVVDNGNGTMHTVTTVTKKIKASDGTEANEVVVDHANSDVQDYAAPTFGFVNDYNPTPATVGENASHQIQVTKHVTGADSATDYTFTLTATGNNIGNIEGLDRNNQLTVSTDGTIKNGKSQTKTFGELTFTEPGTYTFTVQENQPTKDAGWTFDDADGDGATDAHTVTVYVTDRNEDRQYDGNLYIDSVTGSPVEITNSYKADPVIVGGDGAQQQITVQKSVTGADSTADFKFQIEPVDPGDPKWNNVKAVDDDFTAQTSITGGVKQGESKTASFAGIQFNATGEYRFKITEVGAADFNKGDAEARAGWTYDEHEAIVTVNVTDDNFDGQLDAAVSYDNGGQAAEFTNKYEAGSATLTGSTNFKGTKTIEGRNGIEGETFGFTLEQGSVDDGASWDAVTFQPKDGDASAFNTATATATMQKGKNSADFSFDGTFTFAKAGTYTFNVTETSHNGEALPEDGTNGMTYDRHTGTITVTVTDDGKGNLHATAAPGTITEGDAENDMTFENAYQATPGRWGLADSELLGGHKYINDTTGNTYTLEADQFSFTMRAQAAGNPMPEGWDGTTVDDQGRGMMTVTNGTGNATDVSIYDFGWIEFTHADMAGATEVENKPGVFTKTFQYNIFEIGTMPAGISRDNTAYTVTFTVTEDHNTGKITVAMPTATKIVEGSGGAGDPADVTKLDFTNTYNPTSIEGHQNFFKTLVGRNWQQGDSFTFDVSMTATEADGSEWPAGAPLPSVKASDGYDFSEVKTNAAGNGLDYIVTINPSSQTGNTYRFDTGTITYEREGIYTWTVSEQQSTVDHVTSDGTVYTITVTVTDEGGVLKRSVQVTGGNYTDHDGDQTLDFTNVYKPNEVTTDDQGGIGNIQVTKKVEGNATSAAFNFKLTLENGDAANVLTNKDDPQSAFPADGITKATSGDFADGDTKAVDFGALTFTAEGDYTFKVVETDTAPANWTYESGDANAKTITIHVADPDNGGQLVASYDKEAKNNQTFTNSYKAEGTLDGDAEGAKNLMVAKTIDGRKFQKDDTFSFQLTADKNNPAVATLPENADGITIAYADGDDTNSKTAAFGDIKFTLPGTYTFHVSEKVPADAGKLGGMTYSDEQYTVTVEVTDAQDGNGKLDAVITKIVNKSGDEVDGLAFTNTYEPGGTTDLPETGEGSIQLRKVLTGKAWDGDEFKFQLTAKGATTPDGSGIADVPMPGVAEKTISDKTGTEDGNDYADFGFGSITYSQAGTYVYEVTEIPGGNAGISYDGHTATVTVSVVDNLHGGFTATASVANGTFTNVYKSELDYQAAGGLEIAKTFENADMREFSFTVKPADQASADKLGIKLDGETLTTTPGATIGDDNASHATVSIGAGTDVTFTQADADKTYTYTVQENVGSNAGVNYDGTVYTVTITTVDDGQGGIQVTTTVADAAGNTQSYVYDNDDATDDQPAVIPFTNTYTATGELGGNGSTSIKATKTLTNRPMTDGEFTFNVTNAADPAGTVVATGTNAADGTITFGAIDYSIDQMMKDVDNGLATPSVVDDKNTFTYQYTVAEDQASFDEGVTAIAGSFGITVTVTDNGDGTLGIAVTYPDGGDGLTFRNAYGEGEQGQATLNIAGEKKLDVQSGNNAPNIAGKYTFTLTGEDGAPMPDTTTATNDAAGNVTFGDVTYTMENVFGDTGDDGTATLSAQRTRTFTYTVTESGAVDGVANDPEASKTFTVTVTDNGDGTLSAVSDPAQGAKFSFTNTYSVKPTDSSATGKGGITVTKKLTGRDMAEGEFTVVMTDRSGAEVARGTNDGKGGIKLSAITFTEPGDYDYNLYEAVGDKSGVTYDRTQYTATAHVEDQGNGTLKVTWTVKNAKGEVVDAVTFHNTYAADPTSVSLGASKVLDGRELKDGEFTFQLTGADESTPMPEGAKDGVATATNAANGSIGFGTIVYDQAGTYQYTVSEVNDKQDGVTYDDTTYEVTVTVTDNTAEGRLEATVDYGDATALVFTNTYKKAEATIPKTGAAVILPSVIGFILLLGAGGMYASKRRKRS